MARTEEGARACSGSLGPCRRRCDGSWRLGPLPSGARPSAAAEFFPERPPGHGTLRRPLPHRVRSRTGTVTRLGDAASDSSQPRPAHWFGPRAMSHPRPCASKTARRNATRIRTHVRPPWQLGTRAGAAEARGLRRAYRSSAPDLPRHAALTRPDPRFRPGCCSDGSCPRLFPPVA
jgi:hypothetical protein